MRNPSERGQFVPLLTAFVVFAGLTIIAIAYVGGGAVDRAVAKQSADAAALAGAAEGEDGARRLAKKNHASLTDYEESDDDATVEVHYGDARAVSRAQRDGGGKGTRPGDPYPSLRAALARAEQILGHKPKVVRASGYVARFTREGFEELAPRAGEAGLCASGPNEMKVCGTG